MTAVEWLYKNLLENPISNQDIEYNEAVFHNAKELEKQQIIEAYKQGQYDSNDSKHIMETEAEQYYNDTFKEKGL
jgi:hypothetical protein